MIHQLDFRPDWISPPGETLVDILEERRISAESLAKLIDCSPAFFDRLLEGKEKITTMLAQKLESVLGIPCTFWLARETQYQEDLVRLQNGPITLKDQEWLQSLPTAEMIKYGWIQPVSNLREAFSACLKFFHVSSLNVWNDKFTKTTALAAFRMSPSFQSERAAVITWVQQGENCCSTMECQPYDAGEFETALQGIRELTRQKSPDAFIPELRKRCADCGVAVVILRTPVGCHASGATKFISAQKAMILLSFRYLSDDHFWFTFFHEAGHLLLHQKNTLFLEGEGIPTQEEETQANDFAAQLLIPIEFEDELARLPVNGIAIMRFARRIGISPGVVVGQLQHRGKLSRRQLNNLKRRFTWK